MLVRCIALVLETSLSGYRTREPSPLKVGDERARQILLAGRAVIRHELRQVGMRHRRLLELQSTPSLLDVLVVHGAVRLDQRERGVRFVAWSDHKRASSLATDL